MRTPSIRFGMALSKHISPWVPLENRTNQLPAPVKRARKGLKEPRMIKGLHFLWERKNPTDQLPYYATKDAVLIAHGTDPAAGRDRATIRKLKRLQRAKDTEVRASVEALLREPSLLESGREASARPASIAFQTAFDAALARASNLVPPN